MKKYYVASKVKHASMWRKFRDGGIAILSTWIDEAGEGQTGDYSELSQRCIREIERCHAVVLYCEPGEILKGALIEVGAALAMNKEIRCVGSCESLSRVFSEHPNWIECSSVTEAFQPNLPIYEVTK